VRLWKVPKEEVYLPVAEKLDEMNGLQSIATAASWDEETLKNRLEQLFDFNQITRLADLHEFNAVVTADGSNSALIDLEPVGGLFDVNDGAMSDLHRNVDPRIFDIAGIRKFQLFSHLIAGKKGKGIEQMAKRGWADLLEEVQPWVGCWELEWAIDATLPEKLEAVGFTQRAVQEMFDQMDGSDSEKVKRLRRFQEIVIEVGDPIAAKYTREYAKEYEISEEEVEEIIANWTKDLVGL